jgi:uncharacterized protein YndB with AHSA1/START domain
MRQGSANIPDIDQDVDIYSLRTTLRVRATAERAFAVFTGRLADWWVKEYTWCGPDALVAIGIEPRLGGMAYEIGPHGFRCDWGRVTTWLPPRRLVLTWQIGPDRAPVPDPAKASEVDACFTPEGGMTRVVVEHRGFDRHGKDAEGYREALTAGWHELLSRYTHTLEAVVR